MKVKKLFDYFDQYFLIIGYFDKTNNIQDTYDVSNKSALLMNEHFLNKYMDFDVIEWSFNTTENFIWLEIEKGE